MSEVERVRKTFRIVGRVQGVYYRVWTRDTAIELGLCGTVRNLADGSVEARVAGTVADVGTLESRMWEGPPAAKVERVDEEELVGPIPEEGFSILH